MSMLAEQKTRPSWVLNPRCSDWSKDQNKLGQKMLEKMGWSVGKGLGAKEQGRVEALRINYKNDVRGLGASRKKEQEYWLQQQDSFQSLLQDLNGGSDKTVDVKSLEQKSKTSKSRVHYHKFTRGKDLSRYSQKDLSCIVGGGFTLPNFQETSNSEKTEPLSISPVQDTVNLQSEVNLSLETLPIETLENDPPTSIADNMDSNSAEVSSEAPKRRSKRSKQKITKNGNEKEGLNIKVTPNSETVPKKQSRRKKGNNIDVDKSTVDNKLSIPENEGHATNSSKKTEKKKKNVENIETNVTTTTPLSDLGDNIGDTKNDAKTKKKAKRKAQIDKDDGVNNADLGTHQLSKKLKRKKKNKDDNSDCIDEAEHPSTLADTDRTTLMSKLILDDDDNSELLQSTPVKKNTKKTASKPKKNTKKTPKTKGKTQDVEDNQSAGFESQSEVSELDSEKLVNDLVNLGPKVYFKNINLPESARRNHILATDSEDDNDEEQQKLTGIPPTKKNKKKV